MPENDVLRIADLSEERIAELIAPIDAYLARAANRPTDKPVAAMFAEIEEHLRAQPPAALAVAAANTFFNDISEFQPVVNASYPFPMLSMRVSSGWRTDKNAVANWKAVRSSAKVQVVIGYVVFIPGQLDAALASIKEVFGAKCPDKVALMIDMESGSGFAGPGNHSVEANKWLAELSKYTGSPKKLVAYANYYDFRSNWPQIVTSVKKITASYGLVNPGTWGWQYAGGDPRWSSPSG